MLILTAAYLYASGFEFLPMRFVFFAAAFAWPIVLTIGLVAPVSWRGWLTISGIYFLLFATISGIGLMRSEAFTWDQAVRLWLLTNVPGTFLILAFLPRPIRAVGPLVHDSGIDLLRRRSLGRRVAPLLLRKVAATAHGGMP